MKTNVLYVGMVQAHTLVLCDLIDAHDENTIPDEYEPMLQDVASAQDVLEGWCDCLVMRHNMVHGDSILIG